MKNKAISKKAQRVPKIAEPNLGVITVIAALFKPRHHDYSKSDKQNISIIATLYL
jgi:hypothetical protein